jgi:hypothetical protein
MLFRNPKRETHNFFVHEGQNKDFKNMLIRHNFFEKQKKYPFQKDFWR